LVYYGQRYYNPTWGRFINRDPAEETGGVNLYGFCENDGINRFDAGGMGWVLEGVQIPETIEQPIYNDWGDVTGYYDEIIGYIYGSQWVNVPPYSSSPPPTGVFSPVASPPAKGSPPVTISVPTLPHSAPTNIGASLSSIEGDIVMSLLINEVPFKGDKQYVSLANSEAAMLAIAWELYNRLNTVPPGYTQHQIANVNVSGPGTIQAYTKIITAPGQFQNFSTVDSKGNWVIASSVANKIQSIVALANLGSPGDIAAEVNYAITLANELESGSNLPPDPFASQGELSAEKQLEMPRWQFCLRRYSGWQ
jgi:hypothetical protein